MADTVVVSSPEGARASLEAGATVRDALTALGLVRGMVVVGRVDGTTHDLASPLPVSGADEPLTVEAVAAEEMRRQARGHVACQRHHQRPVRGVLGHPERAAQA